jgi:hypothetical protein
MYSCRAQSHSSCLTKLGFVIIPSYFWLLAAGYPRRPLSFIDRFIRAGLSWTRAPAKPSVPPEETEPWPGSSDGQIFLIDWQAVHYHRKTSFSFTLRRPSWNPSRANGYIHSAAEANNLGLQCGREISWIADSRKSGATHCNLLTGTADPPPVGLAEPVTDFQLRPTSYLACSVLLLGNQIIHSYQETSW